MKIAHAVIALALANAGLAAQHARTDDRVTVPFSDPSRPGTVRIRLVQGSLTVTKAAGRDVVVDRSRDTDARSDRRRRQPSPRADGLRRLNQPPGLTIEEESNNVLITAPPESSAHLQVQVPARTNLQLSVVNGGDIVVEGVEGDIEVDSVNGGIRLTDVAGAIVAHSVNGGLFATVRQVSAQKPLAFTSLNGEVDVTLPSSLKANLKLRSEQGDIYTDFEVQPTAPPAAPPAQPGRSRARSRDDKGKYKLRLDRAVYGTVNGGGPEVELRTFNGDVYLRKGT